jgi:hypothetical protein
VLAPAIRSPPRLRGGGLRRSGFTLVLASGLAVCGLAGRVGAGGVDIGAALVPCCGQHRERPAHVDAEPLGELALGLLDDDPAVQGGLELLGGGLAAAHVPLEQQPDCG